MIFGITATSNFDYGCTQGEEDKQVLLRHYPLLEDRLIDGCMRAKRYNTLYQLIEVDTFEEIMGFVEKYNRIVIEKLEDDKGETRYVIEIYDYWRE